MGVFVGILSGFIVLINVTFLAIGIVILAVAGIRGYSFSISPHFYINQMIFIAGGVLLLVNFIGGCCLGFRKKATTASYGCLMVLIIIAEVALVFYLIDQFGDLKNALYAFLDKIYIHATKRDPGAVVFVEDFQYMFDCCGLESYGVWSLVNMFQEACSFFKTGCGDILYQALKMFSIGILSLEVIAGIFAFTVAIIQKNAGNSLRFGA